MEKTALCDLCDGGAKLFERPFFTNKEVFLDMLYFNGQEDVDPTTHSEALQKVIQELLTREYTGDF